MKKRFITLIICISIAAIVFGQQGISISDFNVENKSDSELSISVNYNFSRKTDTKDMLIHAYPVMSDGKANYRDVLFESHPIETGRHNVNFTITKKPGGKDFKSESIKVCMINKRSILLCEEFSYSMLWSEQQTTSVKINSFISSETQINKGEDVTLSWETENASKVMLGLEGSKEFYDVPTSGSETVHINKTSTYVLMASPKSSKGPTAVESRKVKISVSYDDPVIGTFYTSNPAVRRGLKSSLLWKVFNADIVTLNDENVEALGEKIVSPTRTTRYVLKAHKGEKIVEEFISVYVTPFAAPKLSKPVINLELCKSIDTGGGDTRCISSDGPFFTGDTIYLIARFKDLPKGKHSVKRITYKGFLNNDKWIKAHQEESNFQNPGTGKGILTFPIVNLGEGAKKLEIIFDDKPETKSEIVYCIDCSRVWE